jgi:hypothetical protein
MKKLLSITLMASAAIMISLTGCNKEGPAGANGADGTNGMDANETCKLCHVSTVVDAISTEFQMSKHEYGVVAEEEAGNLACAVCHCQEAFKYVCKENTSTVFTFDATANKWVNPYATAASDAWGKIGCFTCHSSLHTTYGYSDVSSLTTIAAVPMTMWSGAKTIDLPQDGGKSNLCVKCHQPRPLTYNVTSTGPNASNVLPYDSLANFPGNVFFDSTGTASSNPKNKYTKPSYRMHVHYGAVGALYAGKGGIELVGGSVPYTSSPHTTLASCQDCHMAPVTSAQVNGTYYISGGHTFSAIGNFNGCNVSGCHESSPISASSTKWTGTRTDIKNLLDQLATKINAAGGGHDILHVEADASLNLWAGLTTGNYDGYLDIYSSSTNPLGYWSDPYGSGATNAAKPKFPSLKFGQVAAMINFQFCLREFSLGIHNTQYSTALLQNSIDALTALGF